MPTTTVPHTIEMMQDILAIHGFPQILVSDNGPQKELGIRHSRSVPYHPATNGLAENMVKNVKQWLSKQSCGVALYEFLHAYRNAHGRVACSNPIWMCTSYWPSPCNEREGKRAAATTAGLSVLWVFCQGAHVLIRGFWPDAPCKWMPGTILSPSGPLHYTATTHPKSKVASRIKHILIIFWSGPNHQYHQTSLMYHRRIWM